MPNTNGHGPKRAMLYAPSPPTSKPAPAIASPRRYARRALIRGGLLRA